MKTNWFDIFIIILWFLIGITNIVTENYTEISYICIWIIAIISLIEVYFLKKWSN